MKEKNKSVLMFIFKVALWRLISILTMATTIHLVTGDLIFAGRVTLIVQVVQTAVHAFFEIFWKDVIEKK